MSRPRNEWKFFWDLWKPHRLYGLFLVFLTLLATICSVLLPLFFKYLIDTLEIFARQKTTPEIATPLMFLLAQGLLRVVTSLYPFFRARMYLILEKGLRNLAFESILKKDYRFFLKFRTGDLVTRLTEDLSGFSKVSWFACSGIFRAFNSSSILIFCAVAMFLLHPVMAFLSLLPLPLALLIFQRLRSSLDDGYEKIQKAISDTGSHIETCVSGIRVLKAYTSEQKEARRFEQILGSRLEKEMQVVKLQNSLNLYYEQ